jgi:hypothetical protein
MAAKRFKLSASLDGNIGHFAPNVSQRKNATKDAMPTVNVHMAGAEDHAQSCPSQFSPVKNITQSYAVWAPIDSITDR